MWADYVALLVEKYHMNLREAWDTSFPEVVMLSGAEERRKPGGRQWLENVKKRMGVLE